MVRSCAVDIRLSESLAVDEDVTVNEANRLARQRNHPLDEVIDRSPGLLGTIEDDDVAAIDLAEHIAELVHEDPIVDGEGVVHRSRRNEERLEQERLYQERYCQCADRDRGPFDERP